jgi:solute carrier family 35 (UDP-xylose/UDP-N-acetylglucosamine transporter), member B4
MGIYLESTYARYGSNWREGLFYTVLLHTRKLMKHFLGLPFFIPLLPRIFRDFHTLTQSPYVQIPPSIAALFPYQLLIPRHILFLIINVATQYLCVRGVNRLSAISTALTITIILNIRKFTSLALSVIVFGNKLATGVKIGAILVALGAAWYAYESGNRAFRSFSC